MSKFRCKCGYLLSFVVYPSRYDGSAKGQRSFEMAENLVTTDVRQFLDAVRENRRDAWLRDFYGSDPFEIDDANIISDLISRHFWDGRRALHQCERCGRLWLQAAPETNEYDCYVPEGDWRGALENPPEDFVEYVEGQDFFNAVIADVRQEAGNTTVVLRKEDGQLYDVEFTGVTLVTPYSAEETHVRFLSEWKDAPPYRRFVFDNAGESSETLLEIIAQTVRLS